MKNKIITAVCLTLCSAFILSSCSSSQIKTYTDKDGKSYDIVYDENGNFVTNDNKLQVYLLSDNGKRIKDESGEYRTEFIEFNGQITDGHHVQTKELEFTLPSGFTQSYDTGLLFLNDDIGAQIYISVLADADIEQQYKLIESNCSQLQESYGSDRFSYDIYDLKTSKSNVSVRAFKLICTSSDYPKTDYYYYFNVNDRIYLVNASVTTDFVKKVKFDSFAKSFVFK